MIRNMVFFIYIRFGRIRETRIIVYRGRRPAAHILQPLVGPVDRGYLFFQRRWRSSSLGTFAWGWGRSWSDLTILFPSVSIAGSDIESRAHLSSLSFLLNSSSSSAFIPE